MTVILILFLVIGILNSSFEITQDLVDALKLDWL